MQAATAVLGWDIGWSLKSRSSGLCCLSWEGGELRKSIRRCTASLEDQKQTLQSVIGNQTISVAALDGPLRSGLSIKDSADANYRDCERSLTRRFQKIGKPGQSSSPNGKRLHKAATDAAGLLLGRTARSRHMAIIHPVAIVEAFPTSFLGVMLDDPPPKSRLARSDQYFVSACAERKFDALLSLLLPGIAARFSFSEITNHDERAAMVCALTALCVHQRRYAAVGDAEDGFIVLPPMALWSRWARDCMRQNLADADNRATLIEES